MSQPTDSFYSEIYSSISHFPCGCSAYYEPYGDRQRLVVMVNADCKWDAPRVGRVLPYVRYIPKATEKEPQHEIHENRA